MKIWDVLDCKIHLLFIIDYLFGPSWKQIILNQLAACPNWSPQKCPKFF